MTEPQDPRIAAVAKALAAMRRGPYQGDTEAQTLVTAYDVLAATNAGHGAGERRRADNGFLSRSVATLGRNSVARSTDTRPATTASREEAGPFGAAMEPHKCRKTTQAEGCFWNGTICQLIGCPDNQPAERDAGAAERERRAVLARDSWYDGKAHVAWLNERDDWFRVISALDAAAAQRAEPDEGEVERLTELAFKDFPSVHREPGDAPSCRPMLSDYRDVVRAVLSAARPVGGEAMATFNADLVKAQHADIIRRHNAHEALQAELTASNARIAELEAEAINMRYDVQLYTEKHRLDLDSARDAENEIKDLRASLAARAQGVTAEQLAIAMVDDQMLPRSFVEETLPRAARILSRLAIPSPAQDADRVLGQNVRKLAETGLLAVRATADGGFSVSADRYGSDRSGPTLDAAIAAASGSVEGAGE